MLLNPYTMAPEIAMPRAADFPLPLPAVRLIVAFKFFSEIVSTIVMTDRAWSRVLHLATRFPIGLVSLSENLRSLSCFWSSVRYKSSKLTSFPLLAFAPGSGISSMSLMCFVIGRMLSSSSIAMQV